MLHFSPSGHILRFCGLSLIFGCIFTASFMWYLCSDKVCTLNQLNLLTPNDANYVPHRYKLKASRNHLINFTDDAIPTNLNFYKKSKSEESTELAVKSDFNIKGSDVIVFLHIQNTGGSVFARHMVEDLELERPCWCKRNHRTCKCYRPNNYGSTWFFSRYTTGWKCGVHPDWSELSNCVDRVMDEDEGKPLKRRYFFMTVLRDPVKRFLSEFWHLRKGQSWLSSRHWCSGVEATETELPTCFDNINLKDLTLEQFMNCSYNLAINRQSRMLSDLALVGCYNSSSLSKEDRDLIIITSAKNNLHKLSFFGLSEFPKVSQYMFETTFDLNFKIKNSAIHNSVNKSMRKELFREISSKDIERIKSINYLDMELYHYAKELLFLRFEKLKKNDPSFENNFNMLNSNKLSTEDWAEKEDFIDRLFD